MSVQSQQSLNYSILNMDYNNIQNRQQLQKIIIQSKAIVQNKIKHINQLSQLRDKEQSQRQIIINRMQQNNQRNFTLIQQYKTQIFSINQSYQRFLKQSEQQKDKQRKGIQTMHQMQVAQIVKRIQQLQGQYKKLKQFQETQNNYLTKIDQMKKQIILRQYEHHDNMNKEESFQLKENKELESKFKNEVGETKKNAHSQAIDKISLEVNENQQQNIKLKQKLKQLQVDLGKLKKQRNEIVLKRKQLKINVTLNEQQLEEYKAVGSLQKAKIKAYKDKIENLKILISQQVSKKQKTLSDRKKQRQSSFKTLKLKMFNLQKQREELKNKMQKINMLGQTIMEQRTEIEQFFVMALESCKREINGEYETISKKSSNDRLQENNNSNKKVYGDKVDIEELLPKDKQRILTNLYTKLAFGSK